ncbi:MAG: HemK family protein methyltransferase, partial [Candidatus Omnitrophica bacterium]|nr:HemK family protein methyltransferase [Candidatus Omnitrophota bacterium]
ESDLFVNSGTFIPRPETELLVKEAVVFAGERFGNLPEPYAVDLGAGSGCITVSFLKKMPNWHVTSFELLPEAVQSTLTNIRKNGLDSLAVVIHKNYFDSEWTDTEGRAPQLILANPPYISENDYQTLPAEVQKEPYAALVGGEKGYEIPQQILRLSVQRLAPNGLVMMEIGAGQSEALRIFAEGIGLKVNRIIKDEQGHDRIMIFEVQHG